MTGTDNFCPRRLLDKQIIQTSVVIAAITRATQGRYTKTACPSSLNLQPRPQLCHHPIPSVVNRAGHTSAIPHITGYGESTSAGALQFVDSTKSCVRFVTAAPSDKTPVGGNKRQHKHVPLQCFPTINRHQIRTTTTMGCRGARSLHVLHSFPAGKQKTGSVATPGMLTWSDSTATPGPLQRHNPWWGAAVGAHC